MTNPYDTDDVVITPGYVGIGDKPNEVVDPLRQHLARRFVSRDDRRARAANGDELTITARTANWSSR